MVYSEFELLHLHWELFRWHEHRPENKIIWTNSEYSVIDGMPNQYPTTSDLRNGPTSSNRSVQMVSTVPIDSQKQIIEQSPPFHSVL